MDIIKKLIIYFFAAVFHLIPRNENIWLTGKCTEWEYGKTAPMFFDNSKYFFLYLVNNTDVKCYWISNSKEEIQLLKSMNLPAVKFWSLKGLYLSVRAKYFFHHYGTDHIDWRLQRNAIQINLWHGTFLKKIRFDVISKNKKKKNWKDALLGTESAEYLISTSEFLTQKINRRAFDLPKSRILDFGYPRNDILCLNKLQAREFCKLYSKELLIYIDEAERHKKCFLYMPTYRDDDPEYLLKAGIDFETLNVKLKEMDALFFIKLHPITADMDFGAYSNIMCFGNDIDVYPFLIYTDYLVTDYSSIMIDYLLLDKEIIFIPYDLEKYTSVRQMYFDFEEVTPGKKYYNFNEFISDIKNVDSFDYKEERKRIKDLFIEKDYQYDASERIFRFFRK